MNLLKVLWTGHENLEKFQLNFADSVIPINNERSFTEEAKMYRRNLFTIWLDHKKIDSVLHDWIIEALKLAKVPKVLITAIDNLTRNWSTRLTLQTDNGTITTDYIEYLREIFQGDSLSLLLFVLSVNPLSFLLNHTTRGYKIGKPGERNLELTHNFFVDDLKLYSENQNEAEVQLDVVTKVSKDIGMSFREEKCAYVAVERGQRKSLGNTIQINDIKIRELNTEKSYRYLGIDENIGFNDQLNKETVSKEYFRRVKKFEKVNSAQGTR